MFAQDRKFSYYKGGVGLLLMEEKGKWVSILEYSSIRGISISTVRRYIKSERLKFRMEQGKYLIYLPPDSVSLSKKNLKDGLELENLDLKGQLKRLREENNDLRMLVNLYENKQESNQLNESV